MISIKLAIIAVALAAIMCLGFRLGQTQSKSKSTKDKKRSCLDVTLGISGAKTRVRWEQVVKDPNVVLIHNFLSPEECRQLIALADPLFKPSTVVGNNNNFEQSKDRTSFSAPLPQGHEIVKIVEERCASISSVPVSHMENIQAVRYTPKQFYRVHHDAIIPQTKKMQQDLDREGQRLETFFIYLNDMEEGETQGATHFPALNDLKIQPRQGTAVYWRNCMPGSETIDKRMYHAGLPPLKSIKYGLNVWTRAKPRNP